MSILAIVGAGGLGAILVLNSDPKERMLGKHLVATAVILSIVGLNSSFLVKTPSLFISIAVSYDSQADN